MALWKWAEIDENRTHPRRHLAFPEATVRPFHLRRLLLVLLFSLGSQALPAQSWDALSLALGWAHQDKDDSFTFYDEFSAALQTWTLEGGLVHSTPLGQMPVVPEKWIIDPLNNHWVIAGTRLIQVGPKGTILRTSTLPAEVADVGWDLKGFIISYLTPQPYLEKRDYFTGTLVWSYGTRQGQGDAKENLNRRPILVDEKDQVLLAEGSSLSLTILNGATGKKVAETHFRLPDGSLAPSLEGAASDRGPMALWPGHDVVFATVPATQVPARLRPTGTGLVLARLDLNKSSVEFLPIGLDESHLLIGMLDTDAVFVKPKGGLQLVKVR